MQIADTKDADCPGVLGSATWHLLSHLRDPLHRGTYLLSANLTVTTVCGVLFWLVASRALDPAEIGVATAFIAPTNLLVVVLLLGANHGVLRFASDIEQDPRLLFSVLWLAAMASAVGGAAGALLLAATGLVPTVGSSLLAMCSLYAVLVASGTIWTVCEAAFVALRAPDKMLARNLGVGVARVALVVPFVGLGVWGLVAAFTAGMALAAGWSVYLLARLVGARRAQVAALRHGRVREVLGFSLPNHGANLVASVPLMALPLIALNALGSEASGSFYVAWMIAAALRSVLTAASATLLAEGARDHSRVGARMGRSLLFLSAAVGAVALPMVIAPQVFLFPFGEHYVEANGLALPLFALSMLPGVLSTALIARERVRDKVGSVLFVSALNGVMSVALAYAGARLGGYEGFATGYLLAQVVVGLAGLIWLVAGRAPTVLAGEHSCSDVV
jgi:O-antigen/teichoic acid export membrane protein